MHRRGFILGAGGLLVAGCARVAPPAGDAATSSSPAQAGPLSIGHDASAASTLLAQLLVGAIAAKGRAARPDSLGDAWQAALGSGELAAQPAFATTLWTSLSDGGDQPAASDLAGEVASLLAPEVSILPASGVDGSLVWLVTQATAEAGITDLSRLAKWSKGREAVVPAFAVSRADGVPGLEDTYGATFTVNTVDDPLERAVRLTSGRAGIAAFRRTDYTGASGLVVLTDNDHFGIPDPGVILVGTALTDAEPDPVLSMNAVAATLTTAALLELQGQLAAGGSAADVASLWLKAQGLA
jgi:glycine betaine/choline ABC-type transport system substrate-binding protein